MSAFCRLLLLVLLGPFTVSCSRSPTEAQSELGSFSGVWDERSWEGRAYAVLQKDSLWIVAHRQDSESYYDEFIRIQVPYLGVGAYDVGEGAGQLAKVIGGDAGYLPAATGNLVILPASELPRFISADIILEAPFDGAVWKAAGHLDAPIYSSFEAVPTTRRW